jgi:hypothetical protein
MALLRHLSDLERRLVRLEGALIQTIYRPGEPKPRQDGAVWLTAGILGVVVLVLLLGRS